MAAVFLGNAFYTAGLPASFPLTFPLTISVWVNRFAFPAVGPDGTIISLYDSGNVENNVQIRLDLTSGPDADAPMYTPTAVKTTSILGETRARSSSSITAAGWKHMAIVFPSIFQSRIYFDGYVDSNSALGFPTVNSISIGNVNGVLNGGPCFGGIAEIGIWNIALTQNQIDSLSKGFSPKRMLPNLKSYIPLYGNNGDIDLVSGLKFPNTINVFNFKGPIIYK